MGSIALLHGLEMFIVALNGLEVVSSSGFKMDSEERNGG